MTNGIKALSVRISFIIIFSLFIVGRPTAVQAAPDIKPYLGAWENRVDIDGDRIWDHYWKPSRNSTTQTCTLTLYRISDQTQKWSTNVPNCLSAHPPIFHWRSFMGSGARDFTWAILGPESDRSYHLKAGDGATGTLRRLDLFMGDSDRAGITRTRGVTTVDLKLPAFPGPALAVRTNGAANSYPPDPGSHFHIRLFYFPATNNDFVELTTDASVIKPGTPWVNFPFIGADLPLAQGDFDSIYNQFNPVACLENDFYGRCGVPDKGTGKGGFMGKLMAGDIDADGVEDLHTTFWSVQQTYPGRPKGSLDNLGAPMYHMWYNPEFDTHKKKNLFDSRCHNNRHYGLSLLTQADADPYLEMVDVAGTYVNDFLFPQQNITRNVGLIDAKLNDDGNLIRKLKWNRPMWVTKPDCTPKTMYQDALHYPSQPLIKDSFGRTKYIQFNRYTQQSQPKNCPNNDLDCYRRVMTGMTGYWSWEFIEAADGNTTKSLPNYYLWGIVPGSNPRNMWVIYSTGASNWNLGYTDISGTTPLLRNDVTIGFLDTVSLQLSQVQQLADQVRPYLKLYYYQSIDQSPDSQANNRGGGNQVFSFPTAANQPDQFLLVTSSGYSMFAYSGTSWRETAKYDGSGNPIAVLPGDIDGNGKVDMVDYNLLLADFGKSGSPGFVPADINENGSVDIFDYSILVGNFGR